LADEQGPAFGSEGFERLFATLDDDYLRVIDYHLREFRFRRGALISADLGRANRWHPLRPPEAGRPASYSFTIPARDEHGFRALSELRGRGINLVANALAQSTDHILSFFNMLRAELGFYIGCLNLHEQLIEKGEPTCSPAPLAAEEDTAFVARGLYDSGASTTVSVVAD